ncbi:AraC family transcriptional regulator [Clostridium saccharobutylicum]|uniref:Transcriptional regulator, AraC family n=1 Tax=Clostridium saccharobutylicum DSM 13864 TaxID=1345695 RepID=U5MRW8_CLOSA|nr:AraC family transcriptional regulator [Clostridium saccharobutylicum]AGX43534.1 transcriptional regulator, AraC family [Clostridium saccharobutylicum DSM 13864]AQR90831.1 multiple antibiotic resistance protein MarA [Clostridium saccharobutylicum]AQS00735.1 multiple antibiotic resistance protein MarA [Clostridium saccharobutylicum]AQS10397.1 multiple antibiotic resistance protein MarA [Clostridium saccharobutylicum]AQS14718.1 multiple antibiotic resistance protein MarA [Clostridium saccharob
MKNLKETIASTIDYIEENLYDKISLDDISQYAGVSKYYLHRIFKSLTGESIIEYVQSRKLTRSIDELVNTNMRIIDIALNYGFDYEQSYIRAFKKAFGCTPLKVRSDKKPLSLIIKEKINTNDILSVGNSITYNPHFVFKQKFNLIGIKHKILSKSGDKTANSYGRDFFYNHKDKINNIINPQVYLGYTDWSSNNNGFIYYIPSAQVSNSTKVPEGMINISIPAHKYVVFRFVGFFRPDDLNGRHIGRLLVQLYRKWIFKSGYKFADTFRFEYIDNSMSKDNYCELYVYQPIENM